MDFLPSADCLSTWLIHYGSFTLFLLLTLGIIAFPVPEETLMVLAGILMRHDKLAIVPTIIATCAGSMVGITMSYIIGRTAGNFLIRKYGRWIGFTTERLEKAHLWFQRFGKWALLIGYFIPGVRHFTGFSAGTTRLNYKVFALFAYVGALVWVSIFLSIGYFFGKYWFYIFKNVKIDLEKIIIAILVIAGTCFAIYLYKKYRNK